MNRSRAVAARQARAFAAAGYAGAADRPARLRRQRRRFWRCQLGQLACGCACGATAAAATLRRAPLCLWGLRSGALLASEVARELAGEISLLLWQPVLSGQQHLQQFLRLSLAADMLEGRAGERGSSETLLAQLESGRAIEVAGYTLAPDLARGLAASGLVQPEPAQRMHCIELVCRPVATCRPPCAALQKAAMRLRARVRGCPVLVGTPACSSCPALEAASLMPCGPLLP